MVTNLYMVRLWIQGRSRKPVQAANSSTECGGGRMGCDSRWVRRPSDAFAVNANNDIRGIVSRLLSFDPYRVVLFSSYALRMEDTKSDIELLKWFQGRE